jgi:ABC-type spermidine/putrescine transport system permease subunit II
MQWLYCQQAAALRGTARRADVYSRSLLDAVRMLAAHAPGMFRHYILPLIASSYAQR